MTIFLLDKRTHFYPGNNPNHCAKMNIPEKEEIQLISVWPNGAGAWSEALGELWDHYPEARELGALTHRKETAVVLIFEGKKLMGLSTATVRQVKVLNHQWLYEYRMFLAPEIRRPGLDAKLLQFSVGILEKHSQNLPAANRPVGVLMQIQNKNLLASPTVSSPQLRVLPFLLIGYTSQGYQLRVLYFSQAKMTEIDSADKPPAG
jgi:hypothetical protein